MRKAEGICKQIRCEGPDYQQQPAIGSCAISSIIGQLKVTEKRYLQELTGIIPAQFSREITLGAILSQRLVHYKMHLAEVRAELQALQEFLPIVDHLVRFITDILNLCNAKNVLDRIVHKRAPNPPLEVASCPFEAYGDYLLKDKFKVSKPFTKILTIYLFRHIVLLTREDKNDTFYYQGHFRMDDEIRLLPLDDKRKKVIKFYHYDKSKTFHTSVVYKFEAANKEVQATWREYINNILGLQHEELRREAYQKHLEGS